MSKSQTEKYNILIGYNEIGDNPPFLDNSPLF